MDEKDAKLLLTASEMSEKLGWPVARTLRYAARGLLPGARRIGSRVYFSADEMDKFLKGEEHLIEIFHTGVFKGSAGQEVQFSVDDLDSIVANFHRLRDLCKVPLKLGHAERQVLDQEDGQPALGWVQSLKRVGNRLLATVTGVPKVLMDAIHAGRYRRVSSEFHLNFANSLYEKNHKTGVQGKVLEAVALLGADLPQVAGLADLNTYLTQPGDSERFVCTIGGGSAADDIEALALKYMDESHPFLQCMENLEEEYPDEDVRLEIARAVKGRIRAAREAAGDDTIQPGSSFHPIRKEGGVYVLKNGNNELGRYQKFREAVKAMRAFERSGRPLAPLITTSGNERLKEQSIYSLLETAERLWAKQEQINHEMETIQNAQAARLGRPMETHTPTLDEVLTDDEKAYLSHGGYAAQEIMRRASDRLAAATIKAHTAANVQSRAEREHDAQREDEERNERFNAALASCMKEMGSHSKGDDAFPKALALLSERYPELTNRRAPKPEDRLTLALRGDQ